MVILQHPIYLTQGSSGNTVRHGGEGEGREPRAGAGGKALWFVLHLDVGSGAVGDGGGGRGDGEHRLGSRQGGQEAGGIEASLAVHVRSNGNCKERNRSCKTYLAQENYICNFFF